MSLQIERDEQGKPLRAFYSWSEREVTMTHELTCQQCGGDLLAGRRETVCERGCAIRHDTPVRWLKTYFPERRIKHNKWSMILKDMAEGARKLAEYDKQAEAT